MKSIHSQTGIIIILLLGIVIGAVHGFYAANSTTRMHNFSGNELCNGPYISEIINAKEGDTIMLSYKSKISRGSTLIRVINPFGEIVYSREDSRPILRQHSIRVDIEGNWKFELECNRAEIMYDINFKIKEEGN